MNYLLAQNTSWQILLIFLDLLVKILTLVVKILPGIHLCCSSDSLLVYLKLPKVLASLGATLLDLGVDKDRAEAVEDFFAKINPFDEAANATAAGKITELIVNLGVPGVPAFNMASGLAKATAKAAKQSGKYLSTVWIKLEESGKVL